MAVRFGYAFDQLLFYGKAGGGWVGNNGLSVTNLTTGVTLGCATLTNFTNCNNSAGGWLVGAGAEWAFAPHWSLKFEYDYLGLGNRTFTVPVTAPLLAGDTFTSNNRNVQMVKVGVNYLWNWAMIATDSTFDFGGSQGLRFSHRSPFYFFAGRRTPVGGLTRPRLSRARSFAAIRGDQF